jgi:hypothetical protein
MLGGHRETKVSWRRVKRLSARIPSNRPDTLKSSGRSFIRCYTGSGIQSLVFCLWDRGYRGFVGLDIWLRKRIECFRYDYRGIGERDEIGADSAGKRPVRTVKLGKHAVPLVGGLSVGYELRKC